MTAEAVSMAIRRAAGSLPGDSARADAELLLAMALGRPRSWLYAHGDAPIDSIHAKSFESLLARRQRGEPVAHILGVREFWSMELAVTADTLIPRPETELLVELALQHLPADAPRRVLDLGTGSGAIALAVAKARPVADVTAVDLEARALQVARKNGAKLGLERVGFLISDWFSAVRDETYDLILSNPPYIADGDPHLAEGDLRFEPRSALASGPDGLRDLRLIAGQAPRHLLPGGWLMLEHGHQQGSAVRGLLFASGFIDVESRRDLEGRERVSMARKPG